MANTSESPGSDTRPAEGRDAIRSARQFRRYALALSVVGVLVQLALSDYYLGVGHAPAPRDLPVGVVGSAEQLQRLTGQLEQDGSFAVTSYPSAEALAEAIRRKTAYGGLDVSGPAPHLYVASAAGPAAASLMRTEFTSVVQEQVAEQVSALTERGEPVAPDTVAALATPPQITDVVPLPPDDRNGASIGFLVQALALGGTVASTGLGRLIAMTKRSYRRGLGHVATLVGYAAGSAAVVLWTMGVYGVGDGAVGSHLYLEFFLLSLAITASTAGAVALVGQAGVVLGLLYFSIGVAISGASLPPEFLPSFWHDLGQALPTGAGASAIRDSLYFPDAPVGGSLVTLGLYAAAGVTVVLVTNALPNRSRRTSQIDVHHELDLRDSTADAVDEDQAPLGRA